MRISLLAFKYTLHVCKQRRLHSMLVHYFGSVFVNNNDYDDGGGDDGIDYDDDEWTNDIKYLANFCTTLLQRKYYILLDKARKGRINLKRFYHSQKHD